MKTGERRADEGFAANLQITSGDEKPFNDKTKAGSLSGIEVSREAPKSSLCNYIKVIAACILTIDPDCHPKP